MARRILTCTVEDMLALREQGLTNGAIAKKLGVAPNTVRRWIGNMPENLGKRSPKAAEPTPTPAPAPALTPAPENTPKLPQKGPSEPPQAQDDQILKYTPATAHRRQKIAATKLFDFALVKDWPIRLKELAALAQPEPWQFKNPERAAKYPETAILESTLLNRFKNLIYQYNNTTDDPDKYILMRGKFCCFHTGLYTPGAYGIYAYFTRRFNQSGIPMDWYLFRFTTHQGDILKSVSPLPEHSRLTEAPVEQFDPRKEIRINTAHMLVRMDGTSRIPEELRAQWNASLLLEAAVEHTRRKALTEPGIVVAAPRPTAVEYLLPLYLTNPDHPDVVAMAELMGDVYYCTTCITPQQAYLYARTNGRPTADWLTELVQTENGGG